MDRDELIEAIFASMQALHRAGASVFHTLLRQYDITPSQLELLLIVKKADSISFKKLAEKMKLTPGAISQMVNSLAGSGFIMRHEDTKDRRISYVSLTETGRKRLKEIWQERTVFMMRAMEDLTTEELQLTLKIQQQILDHIELNPTHITAEKRGTT